MRHLALSIALGFLLTPVAIGAPPLDRLVPIDTVEFALAPDLAKLEAGFHATQFGRLWKEPALQPFRADATTEMLGWLEIPGRLGFKWHDLLSVLSGECGTASYPISDYRIGRVALFDSTGRQDAVNARLEAAAQKARSTGGSVTQLTIGGQPVTVYDVPGALGKRMPIAVFQKDNILAAVTPPDAVEKLMPTWNADPSQTLAGKKAYQVVRTRTAMRPGEPTHFQWFVEPLGTSFATQKPPVPGKKKRPRKEGGELLRSEGFAAMKGIGGSFAFASGETDFIVRMTIYAPEPNKYFGSFRMLAFLGAESLLPPAWVPGNISKCLLVRMNVRQVFDSFGSLFDEMAAEGEKGTFEEVLTAIKKKPGVDIRGEIVDQMTGEIVAITDYQTPFTPKSDRGYAALTLKNPAITANALKKSMQTDPLVTKKSLYGADNWEVKSVPKPPKPGEKPPPPLPDGALCVAQGRFNVATNTGLMDKVLKPQDTKPLLEQADYQRVAAAWERYGGKTAGLRMFSRFSEDVRVTYEMWKSNQLEKAEGIYSRLLTKWAKNGAMPLDGRKLPDYSHIGKYFGPVGIQGTPYADGWDVVGFALTAQPK